MVHVVSETGGPKGKDYCILYNPQWAHLPHDLSKATLLQVRDKKKKKKNKFPTTIGS